MADKNGSGASKGIFASIEQTGKQLKEEEDKKEVLTTAKTVEKEELSVKRSYSLKPSTIRKLTELKAAHPNLLTVTFNEIVDECICLAYESKKLIDKGKT